MAAQRYGRTSRLLAAAAADNKRRVLVALEVIDFSVKQCKGYVDRLENVPFREVVIVPDIDHSGIVMIHKQYGFVRFELFIAKELAFHFVADQQCQNKRQRNKKYPVVDYKWNNILHDTFKLAYIPEWSARTPTDKTQQRRDPVTGKYPLSSRCCATKLCNFGGLDPDKDAMIAKVESHHIRSRLQNLLFRGVSQQ